MSTGQGPVNQQVFGPRKRGVPGTLSGVVVVVVMLAVSCGLAYMGWSKEMLRGADPNAVHVLARVTYIHTDRGAGQPWGTYTVAGHVEDNVPLSDHWLPEGSQVAGLVDPARPRFFLPDGQGGMTEIIFGLLGLLATAGVAWFLDRWRRAYQRTATLPTLPSLSAARRRLVGR